MGAPGGGDRAFHAFKPAGAGISLDATETTGRQALGASVRGPVAWVVNFGPNPAYVKLGDATVDAALTDFPLLPGEGRCLDADGHTNLAAITAAGGSATVKMVVGEGTP